MKVLVYRTGHLGDTVCAIPAFRRLRGHYRDDKLILLSDEPAGGKVAAAGVVDRLGIFDRIVTYRSSRSWRTFLDLTKIVRRIQPDIVIILPQVKATQSTLYKQSLFFRLIGVGKMIGFQQTAFADEWQPCESRRLMAILDRTGIDSGIFNYDLPVDTQARESLQQKLSVLGVNGQSPYLVFCGGGKMPSQHWPLDRYAKVLKGLHDQFDFPILGIGSPTEVPSFKREILPSFPRLKLFPDPLDLNELIELLRGATCYMGNDTGPMHLAAAVGCPVAAIISARNLPGQWDPDIEPRLIFRHRTECEGCWAEVCPLGHHECLQLIEAEEVLLSTSKFISELIANRNMTQETS